ncbi:hypothetical protein ACH5RR_015466, partial [Cinchona calisaya]
MEASSSSNPQPIPSNFSGNRATYTTGNIPRKRLDPTEIGNIYTPPLQVIPYKPIG